MAHLTSLSVKQEWFYHQIHQYIVKRPCWVVNRRRAMKYLTAVLYCAVYSLLFQFSKGRLQRENQHVSTGTSSAFSTIVNYFVDVFRPRDPMIAFSASRLTKMNVIRCGKHIKTINKLNDHILSASHNNATAKCRSRSIVYFEINRYPNGFHFYPLQSESRCI